MSAAAVLEQHLQALKNQNTALPFPGAGQLRTLPTSALPARMRPDSRDFYKVAAPSRANREAISVAGMARGFCNNLRLTHGKRPKMMAYEQQLRSACEAVFKLYGKLSPDDHGGAPDAIDSLDAFWREHRESPAVYVCMVLPMAVDIEATMSASTPPEKREAIAKMRSILEKIYGYLSQYNQTSEDLEAYAATIYQHWRRICA